jgi:thiol-disulfide isomerase/thioredoxin
MNSGEAMIGKMVLFITAGLLTMKLSQDATKPAATDFPVGELGLEHVLAFNQEYRERAQNYSPKPEALEFLRQFPKEVVVEVFYGGWCGDSRDHVPSFIKTLQLVNNPKITTTYIAVDKQKQQPADRVLERHIERVPTFIVLSDDEEIGRIVETPEGSVEENFVKILKAQK